MLKIESAKLTIDTSGERSLATFNNCVKERQVIGTNQSLNKSPILIGTGSERNQQQKKSGVMSSTSLKPRSSITKVDTGAVILSASVNGDEKEVNL